MRDFFKTLAATITGVFISIFLLFILGGILFAGMIAALGDKETKPRKDMILEINLNYLISERTEDNSLLELIDKNNVRPLGLDVLMEQIKRASQDENVRGILLKPGMLSAGYGTVDEIRNALLEFKQSGKFLYAYAEYLTEKNYFLSSVCDSIFLNPAGEIVMNGLSSNIMLYKNMLDKLGIQMELFKVGTHKGAAEVYTKEQLSTENEEQIQRYLDAIYNKLCTDIAISRGLNRDEFKNQVSQFVVQSGEQALELNWIDGLWYEDQLAALLKSKVGKDANQKICYTSLSEYRKMSGPKSAETKSKNKIAVVYITGEITNNSANDNQTGCKSLINTLRKVRYNEQYKAVVLRVNSPGGSAFGSDQIWREVKLINQEKPVIVSMGDVAASGGYYVAAPADSILVSPYTLTGSIGVFALYPNMQEFLNDKIGVQYQSIKTGEYADLGRIDRPFTENEKQIIQQTVNRIYRDFTQVVREGRNLDSVHLENIAQGKVWFADHAIDHKLADGIGRINDAIHAAAFKAGLDSTDYKLVHLPKKEDNFSQWLRTISAVKEQSLQQKLGTLYPMYQALELINQWKPGVQARIPYDLYID